MMRFEFHNYARSNPLYARVSERLGRKPGFFGYLVAFVLLAFVAVLAVFAILFGLLFAVVMMVLGALYKLKNAVAGLFGGKRKWEGGDDGEGRINVRVIGTRTSEEGRGGY